jgi:hypothetical protein
MASVYSLLEEMRMETLPFLGSMWETTPVRISCSLEVNSS